MQCNSSTCDYIDPNSKCHSQAYVHSYLIQLQMFNKATITNRLISLTILVHMLTLTKVRCFLFFSFLVFFDWVMIKLANVVTLNITGSYHHLTSNIYHC